MRFDELVLDHPIGGRALAIAPDGPANGTVVVVPGIHGQTPHILEVGQRLASQGHRTVVAEWFCPAARGHTLAAADVTAAVAGLGDDAIADDLVALVRRAGDHGPVAMLGYCVGGTLALLAAARTDLTVATVVYYGMVRFRGDLTVKGSDPIERIGDVASPVLAHYGTADSWCPPDDVGDLEAALAATGGPHAVHRYPGAGHAFEEIGRPGYRPVAATEAARRTSTFLGHYLTAAA